MFKPMAGRVCPEKPERDLRGQSQDCPLAQSQERARYRITFTVYRRRLLDNFDNAKSALKPTIDRITELLGFPSDDCPELEWHAHQVKSKTAGTHVLIEQVQDRPKTTPNLSPGANMGRFPTSGHTQTPAKAP